MVKPWTVSDLTAHIKALLMDDLLLQDVWVEGEVSNFVQYTSGHCYFSLKDSEATLQCVLWKSRAAALARLPTDGEHVLAHGYIDVYGPKGTYQLYVDYLQPAGIGDLYAQLEALKAKLAAEGLFAEERKRPLPAWPKRIGVVTSPDGAALRDIVRVIRSRFPGVELILSPTLVQGGEAPPQIVAALNALVEFGNVDVIVVARGGGSIEDLWAFNDERVARAIAVSPIPVVSGIGHETDYTLADFAADLRAPTPSAAAMAVVPDGTEVRQRIATLRQRLRQAAASLLSEKRRRLEQERRTLQLYSPRHLVTTHRQRVDELARRLHAALAHRQALARARLESLHHQLRALDPRRVLARGYAIVQRSDGQVVTSVHHLAVGEHMQVLMRDGRLEAWVVDRHPRSEEPASEKSG